METVGVKALKARLSHYVARATAGERIVITDRNKEVAELVPVSPQRRAMAELAACGRLRWSGDKPTGLAGVRGRGKPVAETVLEQRR